MLFDAAGRVLLIRRAKAPRAGQWSLPGGSQELGETVEQSARRELLEETGCTAGPLSLVDVVDSITRDEFGRVRFHYTLVDYCARFAGGEARAGSDATDLTWAPVGGLAPFELWERTVAVIGAAARMIIR